jgi:hypothetical protein
MARVALVVVIRHAQCFVVIVPLVVGSHLQREPPMLCGESVLGRPADYSVCFFKVGYDALGKPLWELSSIPCHQRREQLRKNIN